MMLLARQVSKPGQRAAPVEDSRVSKVRERSNSPRVSGSGHGGRHGSVILTLVLGGEDGG